MKFTSSKIGVQILRDALHQHGVETIVFSPGSRNAPLVIALVESNYFKSVVIHDERSAAFFALGMALASGKPVPVVCTSGSAVLNYAPAGAEAYYQRVPFLVISADRPLEWIDQGAGQTIRQAGALQNFVDYEISFCTEAKDQTQRWYYHREIQNALVHALKGPVHINMPFEEPLYETVEEEALQLPKLNWVHSEKKVDQANLSDLVNTWRSTQKRMIIVGQMQHNQKLLDSLQFALNDSNSVVLSENTSNMEHPEIIPCIDRVLAAIEQDEASFKPELLIVVGGAVISKKIKSFLQKSNLKQVWKVGQDFPLMDTYKRLDFSIPIDAYHFFEQFAFAMHGFSENNFTDEAFGLKWKTAFRETEEKHSIFMRQVLFSDFKVMHEVLGVIPRSSYLHLGNSSVARYAQLFRVEKDLKVFCNRGTSGIDGSMSTAAGVALQISDVMHTLVIGDISFFYDSNALWNNYLSTNLRVILIHNGGGGIFEIIPGPSKSKFRDEFFVAQQNFSAEHLCKAYDIEYSKAKDEAELALELLALYEPSVNGRPKVLEIFTQDCDNAAILMNYFQSLKA
jgi:2-succinyl-5-enolpyruvyl-6-hydroxy-3-cyclohexene-1-carboxylate synthase